VFILSSDGTKTQVFPSKVPFYDTNITNNPYSDFINLVGTYPYSYTVILEGQIDQSGTDGYVFAGGYTFKAASAHFSASNVLAAEGDGYKQIRILSTDLFGQPVDAYGTYSIASVGDAYGDYTIVTLTTPVSPAVLPFPTIHYNLRWELVDAANKSAAVLLTKDLYTGGTIVPGNGVEMSYIDQKDADFFDSNWANALDVLESQNCQIVVPLPNAAFSAIQQATVAHCESMSNTLNQKERVALIGAINGVTAAAVIGQEQVAVEDVGVLEGIQGDDPEEVLAGNIEDLQNYSVVDNWGTTFRSTYFFPDQIIRTVNGTATTLSGFYMGAAAGGYLAGQPNIAIPLTKKILTGFSIPRSRTYKPTMLNSLGNAGVCTVIPVTGGGQVVHGKTTVASGSPEEEELSVVFIRDRVANVLRDVMRGFIGQPEDPTLAAAMTSKATKALQALASQGLLINIANLSVVRDDVDSRQWNLSVSVQPNEPVGWIWIDVSVGQL
jgi:hypothetical protein